MKRCMAGVVMVTLFGGSVSAEPVSLALGAAGFMTTLIGGVLAVVPQGKEYRLPTQTYCVHTSDYRVDVKEGGCVPAIKDWRIGAWIAGAGAGMMVVGFWPKPRVRVAPMLGRHTKGLQASVVWGQ